MIIIHICLLSEVVLVGYQSFGGEIDILVYSWVASTSWMYQYYDIEVNWEGGGQKPINYCG